MPVRTTGASVCDALLPEIASYLQSMPDHELVCTRQELLEGVAVQSTVLCSISEEGLGMLVRGLKPLITRKGCYFGLSAECVTGLEEAMGRGVEPEFRFAWDPQVAAS